jgi:hypothetical protein
MPALFMHSFWTLSNKPRLSFRKQYVEGDQFYYWVGVKNDSQEPFPPSEMVVIAKWRFLALGDYGNERVIHLAKGELAPGASKLDGAIAGVLASGYALLYVQHTAYSRLDGGYLHDSGGREIDFTGRYAIASFRGASLVEIRTLTALYIAALAAAASAEGLVLSVLSFLLR